MSGLFERGRALLVGIAGYSHLKALPDVVLNDVADFADVLRSEKHCGYPPDQVRTLAEATNQGLRDALAAFASECRPDDTAVFVFSGHGERIDAGAGTGSYLCPVEFDPARPKDTGISREELSAMLTAVPARRLLVILDACHSAGSVVFKAGAESIELKAGFSGVDFERLGAGAGRVLFASSREDEYSMILDGDRNSLFTGHILAGLRGAAPRGSDGTVGVLDLFKHASGSMRERSQHPVMKAELESNFPVALAGGGGSTVKSGDTRLNADSWWRRLERTAVDLYPTGPQEQQIWSRAGCEVSVLRSDLNGRATWHAALQTLKRGGSGAEAPNSLLRIMLEDFPANAALLELEAKPH